MEVVTILWSSGATVALVLAVVYGWVWLSERGELASPMLCIFAVGVSTYYFCDLGLMRSATPAEYGEWHRWNHVSAFIVLIGQMLFVHSYLGVGRVWLIWAVIFARSLILVVNFSVHPSFTYSEIVSLGHVSLLGEQVSTLGVFTRRSEWQWLATASLILFLAYLLDAVAQQWMKRGKDAKRKAFVVSLGIVVPMVITTAYAQLIAFGFVSGRAPNGTWMLGALVILAYELGHNIIVSRHERLELSDLRVQLAQAGRVGIMGQLASALAHELSQPLAANSANIEALQVLLNREKPDLEELRSIAADVSRDGRRASEIISRMRLLFRRRSIEMKPVEVQNVVEDAVALVRSEAVSKHVVLQVLIEPGLAPVVGDRVHLMQVLLNLLVNSIDAVQSRPANHRRIVVEAKADDAKGEVEIVVRDSGPGIPDKIVKDVFEPFFTTKSKGLGTGLALARTIVEAHGGRLWIDNMPEQDGATFRFTLPQAPSPEYLAAKGRDPPSTRALLPGETPVNSAI